MTDEVDFHEYVARWREDLEERSPVPDIGVGEHGNAPGEQAEEPPKLYFDVAGMLEGGLPAPPAPSLLHRTDKRAIFYAEQVNLVFGDPEAGKTLVAQAAAAEALRAGRKVLFVDIDHNGPTATVSRFIDMEVPEQTLADQALFRYVEPEDKSHLMAVVKDARQWRPSAVIVDSVGELLPLMNLNSNSPDDFTLAHAAVLKPLALAGAAVLAIDHLPKNTEARASGPTGTAAKRRAVGGVAIRVTINEPFAPNRKGSAWLSVNKDRHGGLRQHCPTSSKEPSAGLFVLDSTGPWIKWKIEPAGEGEGPPEQVANVDDLEALDKLDPPPTSVRDVKARLKWRSERATIALKEWRAKRSHVPGEQQGNAGNTGEGPVPRSPTPMSGTREHPPKPVDRCQRWFNQDRGWCGGEPVGKWPAGLLCAEHAPVGGDRP